MRPGHLERILRDVDGVDVMSALTNLAPTDLQSLLIEVYKQRAQELTPSRVLERYRDDRFVQPSQVDPRTMIELDRIAYSAAKAFTPLELSSVCPLGTVSALGAVSQNNVISTSRNTEVIADATNVLALECARRRKGNDLVRLCASHRLLRGQHYEGPASFAHFRVFSMCTAGVSLAKQEFAVKSMIEQIAAYLKLLKELQSKGYSFTAIRVSPTDFRDSNSVDGRYLMAAVLSELATKFDGVEFREDISRTQAKGYYYPACFWIFVSGADGVEHNVADGGFTDWTQKLLSNKKERLLISGMGTERLCYLFSTVNGKR